MHQHLSQSADHQVPTSAALALLYISIWYVFNFLKFPMSCCSPSFIQACPQSSVKFMYVAVSWCKISEVMLRWSKIQPCLAPLSSHRVKFFLFPKKKSRPIHLFWGICACILIAAAAGSVLSFSVRSRVMNNKLQRRCHWPSSPR